MNQNGWIKSTEKMPKLYGEYLGYFADRKYKIFTFYKNRIIEIEGIRNHNMSIPEYWKELPDPPNTDCMILICPVHRLSCTGCEKSARVHRSWLSEDLNMEIDSFQRRNKC